MGHTASIKGGIAAEIRENRSAAGSLMKFKVQVRATGMMRMRGAHIGLPIDRQRDPLIIKLLKQNMRMILKKAIIRSD